MNLNELIETLKSYQNEYGNMEVVTYYNLPTHSNPHFGSKLLFVDSTGDNVLHELKWNSSYKIA